MRAEANQLLAQGERLMGLLSHGGIASDLPIHLPPHTVKQPNAYRITAHEQTIESERQTNLTATIDAIIAARNRRRTLFPELEFGEPMWDMLLDLALAALRGKRISVSSLCIAAGVPATTALRRIEYLAKGGLIYRSRDDTDGRRVLVSLSDEALRRIVDYAIACGRTFGLDDSNTHRGARAVPMSGRMERPSTTRSSYAPKRDSRIATASEAAE
jgi:hypothetical protein